MAQRRLIAYSVCAKQNMFSENYLIECVVIIIGNIGNAKGQLLSNLKIGKSCEAKIISEKEFMECKDILLEDFSFSEKVFL